MKHLVLPLLLALSGCTQLTPELVHELARDNASVCVTSDIRGGVGSIVAPSGGYGQGTFSMCRSMRPDARIKLSPDGTISIEHGVTQP